MDKSHDDALKTNRNNPAQPSASAQSQKTHPQNPQSQSSQPQDQQSQFISHTPTQNNPAVAFKSDYIGQWAAKQEDPFAEQNRKAAEKKAAQEAARKKAMPYIKIGSIVAACVAVLAVIITVIVVIINQPKPEVPTITGDSSEDVSDYTDILQDAYDQNQNLDDVDKIVEDTLNTDNGREYEAQVRLAEMVFYFDNDLYQQLIDTGVRIDPNSLQPDQRLRYYNYMRYGYSVLNDNDKANEYMDLVFELSNELSGDRPSGGG